jgi:7-carboxy-7-deazaguanine synthase
MTAILNEIYASYQGEGKYLGKEQVFVRFQGCSQHCQWCDTLSTLAPQKKSFRFETQAHSQNFEDLKNPVEAQTLRELVTRFSIPALSLTGGEPLEQADFLQTWLPMVSDDFHIMLETSGVLTEAIAPLLNLIDTISMDIKLPSSTGDVSYWEEHRQFLTLAATNDVYVKCVVTQDTTEPELDHLTRLIKDVSEKTSKVIPLFLQPATPTQKFQQKIEPETLMRHMTFVKQKLSHVALVPQIHKYMEVL